MRLSRAWVPHLPRCLFYQFLNGPQPIRNTRRHGRRNPNAALDGVVPEPPGRKVGQFGVIDAHF